VDKTQGRNTTRLARAVLLFKLGNIFPRAAAVWEIVKKFLSSTEKEQPFLHVVDAVPGDPLLPFPPVVILSSLLLSYLSSHYHLQKCSCYTRPPWATAYSRSPTRPKSRVPIYTRSSVPQRKLANCAYCSFFFLDSGILRLVFALCL